MGTARGLGFALVVWILLQSASPAEAAEGLSFYTVTPCRVFDTRNPDGPFGGPALVSGQPRLFQITGQCGVPSGALAAVTNLTVVLPTGAGHLATYAGDQGVPNSSSLNFRPGQTRANNAIVPLATDGSGTIGVQPVVRDNGSVHLILDVSGYFAPDPPTALISSSPSDRDSDVAVTRETILRFSAPLDPATVTPVAVQADTGGLQLEARIYVSTDRRTVTLFYNDPLPAASNIGVTVDGGLLRDAEGRAVDVDGDGVGGGLRRFEFATLGLQVVPGTVVCGRVVASELATDDTGSSVDVPLEGATVTVDGAEDTLRAVSDANGNFCLDPAPGGRFFVHIDGRTAINGVPPGAYYPYVGKAWDPIPGQQVNVGTAYLPLVVPGTLQPVSETSDTVIHFAPAVLAEFPEFSDVRITVPAGSLFADDGTPGGMVGIAPVPPNRLPGKLPPELEFPVVITVQTDGATNFDAPAPVCFPNLPNPRTGAALPPGAEDGLLSFNHDTGRWEYAGPMYVTADGSLVCSAPGYGILAPGWHAAGPPPAEPPPPPLPPPPPPMPPLPPPDPPCDNPEYYACRGKALKKYSLCTAKRLPWVFLPKLGWIAFGRGVVKCTVKYVYHEAECNSKCPETPDLRMRSAALLTPEIDDLVVAQIFNITEQIELLVYPYAVRGEDLPQAVADQVATLIAQSNAAAGGDAAGYLSGYITDAEDELADDEVIGNAPPYPVLYAAEILLPEGFMYLRGKTGPYGQYSLFVPRNGNLTSVRFYDPLTDYYGEIHPNLSEDLPFRLPRFILTQVDGEFADYDLDQLVDLVESLYGTDTNAPDTDGDGMNDGAEVAAGTDPLGRDIQIGELVAGAISAAGEIDRYSFTALAGQTVYFDYRGGGSSSIDWRLVDETGRQVFRYPFPVDFGRVLLTQGGTYTLFVGSDDSSFVGSYQFQLWDVPAPDVFAITVGDTASDGVPGPGAGRIESPGVEDIYTFTASPGQSVYFDYKGGGASALYWRLVDDTGAELFDYPLPQDQGVHVLSRGGTYTLTVGTQNRDFVGTYQFKLWNVPAPDVFAIVVGDAVSDGVPGPGAGRIESPGVEDIYTFTAAPGQRVFFDYAGGGASSLDWRLVDDTGAELFDYPLPQDQGVHVLTRGGTYTLTVGTQNRDFVGTYQFKLWNVPVPDMFAITVGDAVTDGVPGPGAGRIESPGVEDIYTFTAAPGQRVFFDYAGGGTSSLDWRLVDDTGAELFNYPLPQDQGVHVLVRGGTYTLSVGTQSRDFAGTYAFNLWDVPAPDMFAIAIGDTVSDGVPGPGAGHIETPGVEDVYNFTAAAGQVVTFDLQAGATTALNWRLTGPNGTVFDRALFGDAGPYTLAQTGVYTLTVGNTTRDRTGTYQFQIVMP